MTPTEIADTLQPISAISVPSPISWADEERDITAWLGNELQVAALDKLYSLAGKVNKCDDDLIKKTGNICSRVTIFIIWLQNFSPMVQFMLILIHMKRHMTHS